MDTNSQTNAIAAHGDVQADHGLVDDTPVCHKEVLAQLRKTQLCRFYPNCRNKDRCSFAHGKAEVKGRPDLTKTSLCQAWLHGACPLDNDECNFAHGLQDLKVTLNFQRNSSSKGNKSPKTNVPISAQTTAKPQTANVASTTETPSQTRTHLERAARVAADIEERNRKLQLARNRIEYMRPLQATLGERYLNSRQDNAFLSEINASLKDLVSAHHSERIDRHDMKCGQAGTLPEAAPLVCQSGAPPPVSTNVDKNARVMLGNPDASFGLEPEDQVVASFSTSPGNAWPTAGAFLSVVMLAPTSPGSNMPPVVPVMPVLVAQIVQMVQVPVGLSPGYSMSGSQRSESVMDESGRLSHKVMNHVERMPLNLSTRLCFKGKKGQEIESMLKEAMPDHYDD